MLSLHQIQESLPLINLFLSHSKGSSFFTVRPLLVGNFSVILWDHFFGSRTVIPPSFFSIFSHVNSSKKVNIDSSDLLGYIMFFISCIWLYNFKEIIKRAADDWVSVESCLHSQWVVMFYDLWTKSLGHSCSPLRLYAVSLLLIIQGIV